MRIIMMSMILGIFLIGTTQEVLATNDLSANNFEISKPSPRAAVRYRFKSITPSKYKGKTRINYYPYDGGYTGVYL